MRDNLIRIMVVDDHDLVRLSIKTSLSASSDFEVSAEACDGKTAVELYAQVRPDVVLMDLKMPGMDGIEATRLIRTQDPDAVVVALSSFSDYGLVRSALGVGITSYLLKDISLEALASAIRDAYKNKVTWSPDATATLIAAATAPPAESLILTRSEGEVLRQLADGGTNAQIAYQLTVSISTVKKHVSSILSKLRLRNRAEAAAWAVRHVPEEESA